MAISFFAPANCKANENEILLIFHSPSCQRCLKVEAEIMPELEERFRDQVRFIYHDINNIESYKLLLGLKEKFAPDLKITLPLFFMKGRFIDATQPLKYRLYTFINDSLNSFGITTGLKDLKNIDLLSYFKSFTPLTIVGAGLIDGINPCAFTVIVFFMSFLALQGYRKRELAVIGIVFIFAVFFSYVLIGLGLLGFLYRLSNFWKIAKIINLFIGIFSIILGFLAIFDYFKFRKTRETHGLILQLPHSVKQRINNLIGMHYRAKNTLAKSEVSRPGIFKLASTTFITGFLISILEAVCTGQVYLPTITFVLKTSGFKLQALGYLLLYNFMFIMPLSVIFLFALYGTTSQQFSLFMKKHLLLVKILMALLFLTLGVLLIWRR